MDYLAYGHRGAPLAGVADHSTTVIDPELGLYLLCDGLGGRTRGTVAAKTAASLVHGQLQAQCGSALSAADPRALVPLIVGAIQHASQQMLQLAETEAALAWMGATITLLLTVGESAVIAHVGDSRAYRVNAGGIVRLTVDHSLVESLVSARQISPEEARHHPQSNVIYRTIGDHPQVVVDLKSLRLLPGDRLLLCSDGLSGMLTDEMIRAEIMAAEAPQSACVGLVDAANEAGGEDNCSVILIELKPL